MKLAEVMIDDWAWDIENECPWQINIKDFRNDGNRILGCLKPIPITKEILMANGFKTKKWFSSKTYVLHITDYVYVSFIFGKKVNACTIINHNYKIKYVGNLVYVHELQHALRLCNVNKEIKMSYQ